MIMQHSDGRLTVDGEKYWDMLGLKPPLLYAFDRPLRADGTVVGHDGAPVKVCDNAGGITQAGLAFFEFHRPIVVVGVGILRFRRRDSREFKDPRMITLSVDGLLEDDGNWRRTTPAERGQAALAHVAEYNASMEGTWTRCERDIGYDESVDMSIEPYVVRIREQFRTPEATVEDILNRVLS